jgi:hypothetical protein
MYALPPRWLLLQWDPGKGEQGRGDLGKVLCFRLRLLSIPFSLVNLSRPGGGWGVGLQAFSPSQPTPNSSQAGDQICNRPVLGLLPPGLKPQGLLEVV